MMGNIGGWRKWVRGVHSFEARGFKGWRKTRFLGGACVLQKRNDVGSFRGRACTNVKRWKDWGSRVCPYLTGPGFAFFSCSWI